MFPVKNSFAVIPFSEGVFTSEVYKRIQKIHPIRTEPFFQVEYLDSYLESLSVKTLVIEEHYIDRHYMAEFNEYYARCLAQVKNSATRVHAFGIALSDEDINALLKRAAAGQADTEINKLQAAYLGFIVLRPVPSVPIGRSLLTPFPQTTADFPVTVQSEVHLWGFPLHITGLRFQQQDMGVGACATAAIWCTLHKVAREDGKRGPTPPEVTSAAFRYFVPFGKPDQTPSLSIAQMCEAIRGLGYDPHLFSPMEMPRSSLACIYTFVASGVPTILILTRTEGMGHAVTCVGHALDNSNKLATASTNEVNHLHWVGTQLQQIYVHDDRIGPYVPASLEVQKVKIPQSQDKRDSLLLKLPRVSEEWQVVNILVPLYPKLRRSALGLIRSSTHWAELLIQLFAGNDRNRLVFESLYYKSGKYARQLYDTTFDPQSIVDFVKTVSFSRYVGVLKVYRDELPLCELVLDTTDIDRSPLLEHPLAIVCYSKPDSANMLVFSRFLDTPFLTV